LNFIHIQVVNLECVRYIYTGNLSVTYKEQHSSISIREQVDITFLVSVMATSAFYTDSECVLSRKVEAGVVVTDRSNLKEIYEIQRTQQWIDSGKFKRVTNIYYYHGLGKKR